MRREKGQDAVLTADKTRELLDRVEVARNTQREDSTTAEEPDLIFGLHNRALIGVMVYAFARINAAINMKVRDYFVQGRRGWVRLHENGGKEHERPCHHKLEQYLDEYIAAADIADDSDGPFSARPAANRPATTDVAAGCLPHDPAPRPRRRHQDPDRKTHLSRNRRHHLPEEGRQVGTRSDQGQPLLAADDETLRPARGGDFARRGRADCDLEKQHLQGPEGVPRR